MSLPPGFLDELRTRTSLAQVAGRKVMWDTRKSNQGKGDLWAPCPFHQEKTASFHVDDRKGFYYCFGCHEKGDAIGFVMKTENMGFMEAVETLAAEAGLQMPERDPRAQEKADKRTQLIDVVAAAQKFFRMGLRMGAAAEARAYLDRRGLTEDALDRFGIGYAPGGWQALWDHLIAQDVPPDMILEAGLAKPSNRGGKPYDVFRDRIMFPIADPRGRVIAFGGRAMDPTDNAKYLNSPETPLFDKSRTLYNHGPAREAVGKGAPLIVAEGYMDVIALAEAGFGGAVAPLGTAVTDHHLALLWRMADEPVIALDGDKAGLRAAYRVIDLALPRLEAGKGLRFALMPEGQDPDDLLRAKGPAALQEVLEAAQPLVQLMWQRETEGRVFDSPDRKAALDKALLRLTGQIQDPILKRAYEQAVRDLKFAFFRPARRVPQGRGAPGRWGAPQGASQSARRSLLVAQGDKAQAHLRETAILAAVVTCPELLPEAEAGLERLRCADPHLANVRDALLRACGDEPDGLRDRLIAEIGAGALETLLSASHLSVMPFMRAPGEVELARLTLVEELAKLDAEKGLTAEIAEAEEDLLAAEDERLTHRITEAAQTRNRASRPSKSKSIDLVRAPNGLDIDPDERRGLDAAIRATGVDLPPKPGQSRTK